MTTYVELEDRVFGFSVEPDTPGTCRRTLTIWVESGAPLSEEEYRRISAWCVAELVGGRADVIGWGFEEAL